MASLNLAVTLLGIAYGFVLIASSFITNRYIEVFRLDVLFLGRPSDNTRVINLFAGLAIAGYNIYTLVW